jgi:hypothetical protein
MLIAAAAPTIISGATKLAGQLDKVGSAVQGVFGDTPTDIAREARIDALERSALTGSDAAVVALCYEAFEPRTGLPGDPRQPVDNHRSPESVRADARRALAKVIAQRGGLPSAASQWAVALATPVVAPRPALADVLRQVVEPGVIEGTRQSVTERLGSSTPLIIGGALIVGALLYFALRRK